MQWIALFYNQVNKKIAQRNDTIICNIQFPASCPGMRPFLEFYRLEIMEALVYLKSSETSRKEKAEMLIRAEQSIFTTRLGYGLIERIYGVWTAGPLRGNSV
jgi:hypothetical protein